MQNDATILDYVTQYDGTKSTVHRGTKRGYLNVQTPEPCPFDLGLRKFVLDFVIEFFFKNAEKSASLITSVKKFGLIIYFDFLQKLSL